MGCKYVKDFDFGPPKVQVKAYARGGPVKKDPGCGCGGKEALPARKSVPVAPTAPLFGKKGK